MKKSIYFLIAGFMVLNGCSNNKITLIADSKVISIPIQENNEPMVDLRNQTEIAFGPSPEIPNNTNYTQMRQSVYLKLIAAQEKLPKGIKFCIYEAYRSLALQEQLFEGRYEKVKNLYPDWSHEKIFLETMKLVSPVINLDGTRNVPPHSTGGAIDIYLVDAQGVPLDMGIHPKDWMEDTDGSISQTNCQKISKEAKKNRKIMCDVLEGVGFANYTGEYWHWSYGDRYWAFSNHVRAALFNSVN